jgi:hypothetical protein
MVLRQVWHGLPAIIMYCGTPGSKYKFRLVMNNYRFKAFSFHVDCEIHTGSIFTSHGCYIPSSFVWSYSRVLD